MHHRAPLVLPRAPRIRPWIGLGAGLVLLLGTGCRSAPPPKATSDLETISAVADASVMTLGPNDVLAFSVYGQPEISSPPEGVLVSLEGDLMVPLVGPVPVEGLSQRDAHARITEALARFFQDPVLTLNVVERRSKRFYLLGEFNQPGAYAMDRTLTAAEAMTFGAGLRDGAKRSRVALIRPQDDGLEVHFFNHLTPGARSFVQVRPGDIIFVSQSGAGRFSDQVTPYLQGLGFATSQIASLIIVADRT